MVIFDFRDAKCILFAPFGKDSTPKNVIFAAYFFIEPDALHDIL